MKLPALTPAPLGNASRSRRVDTDEVALDDGGATHGDPGAVVARDDVALRRQRAADRSARRNAQAAAPRDGAGRVRADEAALHVPADGHDARCG